MKDEFHSSRSEQRAKRRKTNLILNSLIALVLLLIFIISYNIFSGDKNEGKEDSKIEKKEDTNNNADKEVTSDVPSSNVNEGTDSNVEQDSDLNASTDSELVETEGGSDETVKKTMINPGWKPVGTTQAGQHQTVYDQNSVDWKEMTKAVSYATGIEESNMTIWFMGRDGQGPNKTVSTVSAKGGSQKYKVYIEWVDGEGWKPTKVEELK